MDLVIRISLYGALGLLLVAANLWFVDRVLDAFGRSSTADRVAPFVIVGKEDTGGRLAAAMPQMLAAHLMRIGAEIEEAIAALVSPGGGNLVVPATASETPVRQIEVSASELKLFQPPDVTMSVGGVEVGGLISWVHRRLVEDRLLTVSVVYHGSGASASGSIAGRRDFSLHLGPAELGESPSDDAIAEMIAYGLMHREYRRSVPAFGALTVRDFRRLLGAVNDVAALNRRVGFGRTPRPEEYATPLATLVELVEITRNWQPLVRLTAEVAENANAIETAIALYESEKDLVGESDVVRHREVSSRLESLRGRMEADRVASAAAPEAFAGSAEDRIRALLGIDDGLPGAGRIGIVGGRPVADADGPAARSAEHAFFHALEATLKLAAPDAALVFHAPAGRTDHALRSSDILVGLEALAGQDVDVILVPFGPLTGPIFEQAFAALADQGRLVVLPAGNEAGRSLPFAGSALLERMMVVAATDLQGRPAPFTSRGEGAFWAPGAGIPVAAGQVDSGTAFAAALAAAVAARAKAVHGELDVDGLVAALQEAAAPVIDGGPPIIHLARTLERLAAGS